MTAQPDLPIIMAVPSSHGRLGLNPPGVWLRPHAGVFLFGGNILLAGLVDRAVLFVDGNNWYHSLRGIGLTNLGRLNYVRVSEKLVAPRQWNATRYYIGRVPQRGDPTLYASQRQLLSRMLAWDSRISIHLGRIEPRSAEDPTARILRRYLSRHRGRIDPEVFRDLFEIAQEGRQTVVMVEKAVDVLIAVDMVLMAQRDEYDTAYLLSGDGDLTPAVAAVRVLGRRVFAVSPRYGAQIAAASDACIRPSQEWFEDCFES